VSGTVELPAGELSLSLVSAYVVKEQTFLDIDETSHV
jgi:hypothetical protein